MINPKSNESYEITVGSPLLRPGLQIRVMSCSKRYAADAVSDLMEVVRMINDREKEGQNER